MFKGWENYSEKVMGKWRTLKPSCAFGVLLRLASASSPSDPLSMSSETENIKSSYVQIEERAV